ncbi:hypothetical protein FE257_004430 [Aspergillus nanangensis]|uniref:N-acetyltransferase domain-containing protein n=1 Tax=Aspergillus nanangensis TaxID=2582783 RepID=A0AAD4GYD8_ASPNN|nr:hypothetical protein FE257_004430 [Aspergillus nanangensis]
MHRDVNDPPAAMAIIRPASVSDLAQIHSINCHYILHTSLTFAQNPPPLATYRDTFDLVQARGLPYLVAVDEGQRFEDGEMLVVGYTYLSPYRGERLSYAPTVELSLFVHPAYQSRAIGSRLLSALLEKFHRGELRNNAFEITGDDEQARQVYAASNDGGDGVPVQNVLAVMAVDPEGKDGGEALRRWYIKRGFMERGRLMKVGRKWNRWVDTIVLQYSTIAD